MFIPSHKVSLLDELELSLSATESSSLNKPSSLPLAYSENDEVTHLLHIFKEYPRQYIPLDCKIHCRA